MPDTLSPMLSEMERKHVADRLHALVLMCDAGKSISDLRVGLRWLLRDIEPFGAEYPKDRPVNAGASHG